MVRTTSWWRAAGSTRSYFLCRPQDTANGVRRIHVDDCSSTVAVVHAGPRGIGRRGAGKAKEQQHADRISTLKFLSMTEVGARFGPSLGPGIVVTLKP